MNMNVINKSARLIDFSWNKKKYRLMPAGKPVDVPDEAMKSTFLKALIDSGDLAIVKALTKEEKKAAELAELREKAEGLDIEVNDGWDAKKLTAEIKKAEK